MMSLTLRRTALALIVSLLAICALAWCDARSADDAALDDFAREQAGVARALGELLRLRLANVVHDAEQRAAGEQSSLRSIAGPVQTHLRAHGAARMSAGPHDVVIALAVDEDRAVDVALPLATLVAPLAAFEQPGLQRVFVQTPDQPTLRALDGTAVHATALDAALHAGSSVARLSRADASALSLPPRAAVAGIAKVTEPQLGTFVVATVVSAERLRDREARGRARLVIGVLAAGGLVSAFGALALRRERRALELGHALAVSAVARASEERLERASRAATLGTLAMGVAHELSTPAMVIAGRAAQLLPRVAADARAAQAVRAIAEQAARITDVVRGFLNLARGDAPPTASVDAAALLHNAASLVAHRFSQAQVQLVVAPVVLVPAVHGDARLLEHAVVNLLLNACDACTRGGTVTLAGAVVADDLCITVSDNGAGISPDHVAVVGEPFFTTKAPGSGTGLGLALATEIVRAHRGRLHVAPRPEGGTCATLLLPVAAAGPASAEAGTAAQAVGGGGGAQPIQEPRQEAR